MGMDPCDGSCGGRCELCRAEREWHLREKHKRTFPAEGQPSSIIGIRCACGWARFNEEFVGRTDSELKQELADAHEEHVRRLIAGGEL